MTKKFKMHVISGTHWDREWRYTAEQSKLRLVDLLDAALELLEDNHAYLCFCVDGGTVVLEDYLTVRPENRDRIKKLVEAQRMQVVNFYTLPETNTVAPESIIRNLLVGQRMANEFGGGMKSGYTATSYGQNSQMPQIYQGFGIETAIFYRGTNKHILAPLFRWEGIDGSCLYALKTFDEVTRTNWYFYVHQPLVLNKPCRDLTYTYNREQIPVHLCDEGLYERAFVLLKERYDFRKDKESLTKALEAITNQAMPYAVGHHLLALDMEDNSQPFGRLPDMIAALNKISPDIEFVQDSLDGYMQTIIHENIDCTLPLHKGELRYTTVERGNFNALFGATHSSRIKLKLWNEKTETNLIHLAEPLAAIASIFCKEYPKTMLDRAWEALLKNHAHDSICGAAVDNAHEDMLYNFSIANTVAEEVCARSSISLFSKIDTARDFKGSDHTITFFNTLNIPRSEVIPVIIDLPKMAERNNNDIGIEGMNKGEVFYDIVDREGNITDYVELSCETVMMGVERELDAKSIKFPVDRRRILIHANIPAMGYATYALRTRGPRYVLHPETGPDRKLIARENGVLENEYLKVTLNPNGTFSLLHKETGRIMENLHYFTDSGETGSAHVSNRPQRNTIITSLGSAARITLIESNLLRGKYKVELSMKIPAAATLDGRDRLRQMVEIPITFWLTLEKGAKFLKIKTRLQNEARDHKLCVNFPSGIRTDFADVESAFAVEHRSIRWTDTGDNQELFYSFQPMQNFVDLNDGEVGLAILNKGLREYEVKDDTGRTIAITLLRTHRAYMTANTDMTPEEFDRYTGLHSFGVHEYSYALYPHKHNWENGGVMQEAYRFKVDVKAIQGVTLDGELPGTHSFFTVDPPEKVMLSALKRAENGQGLVLRLWNISAAMLPVTLTTSLPFRMASSLRLDETPLADLDLKDGKLQFEMGPHKITTILFT
ncbi:MAG: glycoside hydrolase family 38 C-terminal domain-containing protein [Anaerolineaceae bacterium]|jgi:alpha-mannosidase